MPKTHKTHFFFMAQNLSTDLLTLIKSDTTKAYPLQIKTMQFRLMLSYRTQKLKRQKTMKMKLGFLVNTLKIEQRSCTNLKRIIRFLPKRNWSFQPVFALSKGNGNKLHQRKRLSSLFVLRIHLNYLLKIKFLFSNQTR